MKPFKPQVVEDCLEETRQFLWDVHQRFHKGTLGVDARRLAARLGLIIQQRRPALSQLEKAKEREKANGSA